MSSLFNTIESLRAKIDKLKQWEVAANFKGGYQPAIDEYQNILSHLMDYYDLPLQSEVFITLQNRTDNLKPDISKSMHLDGQQSMLFDENQAIKQAEEINKHYQLGVCSAYKCLITVNEKV